MENWLNCQIRPLVKYSQNQKKQMLLCPYDKFFNKSFQDDVDSVLHHSLTQI